MSKKRPSRRKLWMVQRAIVLQLLRNDHDLLWTRSELKDEIPDFSRRVFDAALERLEDETCVVLDGEQGVKASRSIRHLDELELVSI
jgi:DNA-binding HxlR family transcriptional regulator